MFRRKPFEVEEGPILHGLSSGMAGLVAATLGTPADVVKTRIMNQPLDPYVVYIYMHTRTTHLHTHVVPV